MDALGAIREGLEKGCTAIYDADLKGYFDSIPHDRPMACVAKRIAPKSWGGGLRAQTDTHVAQGAAVGISRRSGTTTEEGAPGDPARRGDLAVACHPLPPLASTSTGLYLHRMDERFHFSDAPAQFAGARLVRHGDDFVILARDLGTGIPDWVEAIVAGWRGLTPNREKTRTVRLKEDGASLDFLGFTFRHERDEFGRDKRFWNRVPSAKAWARERYAIRGLVNPRTSLVPRPILIKQLNRQPRGWAAGLRERAQPSRLPRHELVRCPKSGQAPPTSEPAPLSSTRRGVMGMPMSMTNWAWNSYDGDTPPRQPSREDIGKAGCGKTARTV